MAIAKVLMPNMGESIFECTVLKWLIKEGDKVEEDDLIIEVATDKIDTEIGSSYGGTITKLLVNEGDVVKIGSPIAEIETSDEIIENDHLDGFSEPNEISEAVNELESEIQKATTTAVPTISQSDRFYSPLVQSIAKEEGISVQELDQIVGTGKNQRVTKDDILGYLKTRQHAVPVNTTTNESTIWPENDQIIEMDRMRKIIAERMVQSKQISPHVTSFIETDMTKVFNWRNRIKDSFENLYNEKITFTPILIYAIAKAIQKFPRINIQVDGDKMIIKKDVNISMAVALPNGNLITPVIHNADRLTLPQLAGKVNDLSQRARNNKLKPAELAGGTYAMTNMGTFGNLAGTPIIVQPQVGIMAFGVIRKMPSVIETPEGDTIGIRQKMIISHSYDHRVVDGSLGGLFLKEVSDILEDFEVEL